MSQETRYLGLRALLTTWRARLKPEDVGLPPTRRRVPGLRREDVAELVGVTPQWYAAFESGANARHFSSAFVRRVADALRLNEREQAELFRFALPEVRTALEQFERSERDGLLFALTKLRKLVRCAGSTSSFEEAVQSAVIAVLDILSPSSLAVAILTAHGDMRRVIGTGPHANEDIEHTVFADACLIENYPNRFGHTTFSENRSGYPETDRGSFDFRQRIGDGRSFNVAVTESTPLAKDAVDSTLCDVTVDSNGKPAIRDAALNTTEYWGWNSKIAARSVLTHGLFVQGRYRGNLCALWTRPRAMNHIEIETLRTASAIVELATTGDARYD